MVGSAVVVVGLAVVVGEGGETGVKKIKIIIYKSWITQRRILNMEYNQVYTIMDVTCSKI